MCEIFSMLKISRASRHSPWVFKSPQAVWSSLVERSRVRETRKPEERSSPYCHRPSDCRRSRCPAWGAIPAACLIGCAGTGSAASGVRTQEAGVVDSHKAAASSDGHPIDYITPGSSKTYTYRNEQRAGTYWYHDHTMDLTGPHVYAGIAAFYLIHDPAEDSLNLPSGTYDVPLIIQDKQFNADNSLRYDGTQIRRPRPYCKPHIDSSTAEAHSDLDMASLDVARARTIFKPETIVRAEASHVR
jgi:hypothetical protein